MKQCRSCGAMNADETAFCAACGVMFLDNGSSQEEPQPVPQQPPMPASRFVHVGTSRVKWGRYFGFAVGILCAIALISVTVYLILGGGKDSPALSQSNKNDNAEQSTRENNTEAIGPENANNSPTEVNAEVQDDTDVISTLVEDYIQAYPNAQNYDDFSYIKTYLQPGSKNYSDMEQFVYKTFTVTVESYYIESIDYESNNSYVVTSVETYYIVPEISNPYTTTQRCKYRVKNGSYGWRIYEYADVIEVLSKTEQ